VIGDAEAIGEYRCISDYECSKWNMVAGTGQSWASRTRRPWPGRFPDHGGGSGIGRTAKAMAAQGAEVAILDRDLGRPRSWPKDRRPRRWPWPATVTDHKSVAQAFDQVVAAFGGVDILVSNAGAAWQGTIGHGGMTSFAQELRAQFLGPSEVAQQAVKIMRAQGTYGCLLFNTSKQAVNPGKDFGPYGLPKAATLFLVKQYALDHRQGRHPQQCGECRSHPHGALDRRDGGRALQGAWA